MNDLSELILSKFPDFNRSKEFVDKLTECSSLVNIPKGQVILDAGQYIKVIPLLIDGLIKIYREDDDGNEILLYYINSGESCVMSISSSLKDEQSSIKAIVEEDSHVLTVPRDAFVKLLSEYDLLNHFTYDLFNLKYNQLIKTIDSLAFSDTKDRLLNYLIQKLEMTESKIIKGITHRDIARDLSTSREVVSRLLYALQKEGKLYLNNKEITIN